MRWILSLSIGVTIGLGIYKLVVQDVLLCVCLAVSWSITIFNFRNLVKPKARTASSLLMLFTLLGVSATLEISNELRIALRLVVLGIGLAVIGIASNLSASNKSQ
jgi:hypothetical protein